MSRLRTERLLLADDFAGWCAAHPGARVQLFAGAQRMHTLVVPDDLPLRDDAERLSYARLQFTHYFGPAAQDWPLAVWPRGACALAVGNLDEIQATAAAHRVRILSLRPSWTLAPAPAPGRDGSTAVIDDELLTLLRYEEGRLVELQQRHVDEDLLKELVGVDTLQARDLLAGSGGQPGPDFIAQPSRLRALAWAWSAAAAMACALAVVQAQGLREEAQRLAEQSAVLDRLASPAPVAKAAAPNQAARNRAWAAARQLEADWAGRWTELERALPPDLQLVALDMDGKGLRLEGQSSTADAVTQLVDRLTMQAAPGEDIVLTRLQRSDNAAELRFELVRRTAGAAR